MADAQDPLLPDSASTRSSAVADIQTVHSRSSFLAWSSEVTHYQWIVLLVAWLGWVFDSSSRGVPRVVGKFRPGKVDAIDIPGGNEHQFRCVIEDAGTQIVHGAGP